MIDPDYIEHITEWRAKKEASLRAPDGWLSLVGLFWLQNGHNDIGSHPNNHIILPTNPAIPAVLGTLELIETAITLHISADHTSISIDGIPFTGKNVRLNHDHEADAPTMVSLGSVKFYVIKRDPGYAVRVSDSSSPVIQNFGGRVWYPIDESYRVTGTFISHATPITVTVDNSLGTQTAIYSSGAVEFTLNGDSYRLLAFDGDEKQLSIYIRDATSGKTTYPAGRFIEAELHENGTVDLDFNKAYFPPCAFTDYATCPYPPKDNHLSIPILAGERFP